MTQILELKPRVVRSAPAAPISTALNNVLTFAENKVISGSIPAEALTPDRRSQLEHRQRELLDALSPCGQSRILTLFALVDSMAAPRDASTGQVELRMLGDSEALLGLPEWAIRSTLVAFRDGRIGDGCFRPRAGQIRVEAARRVASHEAELRKIERVLSAKIEPPRKPDDPGRRKRMAEMVRRGLEAAIAEAEIVSAPAETAARAPAPVRGVNPGPSKSAEQLAEEFAAAPLTTSDALRQRLTAAKPAPASAVAGEAAE